MFPLQHSDTFTINNNSTAVIIFLNENLGKIVAKKTKNNNFLDFAFVLAK